MKSNCLPLLLISLALCCAHLSQAEEDILGHRGYPKARTSRSPTTTEEEATLLYTSEPKPPEFAEPLEPNSTQRVAVGRSVRITCTVNNLGNSRVSWFVAPASSSRPQIALGVDDILVHRSPRMRVTKQTNVFELHINPVKLDDKGRYYCKLNVPPFKSQHHHLDVVMAPRIKEEETTVKIEPVAEFSSAELRCVADGVPKPVIKWRRESQTFELAAFDEQDNELSTTDDADGDGAKRYESGAQVGDIRGRPSGQQQQQQQKQQHQQQRHRRKRDVNSLTARSGAATMHQTSGMSSLNVSDSSLSNRNGGGTKPFIAEGEVFRIERVSRYDMGFYMCIASNGVPPSMSQRIFLPVSFKKAMRNTTITTTTALAMDAQQHIHLQQRQQQNHLQQRQQHNHSQHQQQQQQQQQAATVGSGRSYNRYRQNKAARSSSVASSAHPPLLMDATKLFWTSFGIKQLCAVAAFVWWCAWLFAVETPFKIVVVVV